MARDAFLGQLCPGMLFDTEQDWLRIYNAAGLGEIALRSGPFEMMTVKGFLAARRSSRPPGVVGRSWSV